MSRDTVRLGTQGQTLDYHNCGSFIFRWYHPNVDSWPTIHNYCDQEHFFDGDDHLMSTVSEAWRITRPDWDHMNTQLLYQEIVSTKVSLVLKDLSVQTHNWYYNLIGAKKLIVLLNYWYKPLAGTTEPFVLRNGWYKCVTGTKNNWCQETIGTLT
jgi:hypothetical protein